MALNVKRMRQKAGEIASGGDYFKFDEGETLIYIHPCLPQTDLHETTEGTNFLEFISHYKVGPLNKMLIGLDPETNPLLAHPTILEYLARRKITIPESCPIADLIESGDLSPEEAKDCAGKESYMWGITPIAFRRKKSMDWGEMPFKPSILQCGKQITNGILDVICEEGDITDQDAAVFVRVIREGQQMSTQYKVVADTATLKAPHKMTKEQRSVLKKAMAPGGDCDLFRVLANQIKSAAQVRSLIDGIELDGSVVEEEDDAPPPKRRPKLKPPEPESEEGAAEEEEEAAPPPKKKPKPEPEPESEEEEVEEEEAAPPPKKKKATPVADDDELDDIDAELARLSK